MTGTAAPVGPLLALDTSSAAVTAAVRDGEGRSTVRTALDGRRHAERLAPSIAEVLAEAGLAPRDLAAVVVGVGPGPFTGLRVGLVTARVLGQVLGIAVHGVCSLDAVAEQARATLAPGQRFRVAADAKRREVHWAEYQVGDRFAVRLGEPRVGPPSDLPQDGLPVVGRGTALYPELLGPPRAPMEPDAGALAELAWRALAEPLRAAEVPDGAASVLLAPKPLYLRRPDAVPPGPAKSVLNR